MAVEFYTWKCKKCGKDINRDEYVALVKVADGKEVSRVVGNYSGAGFVYESPSEIMGKEDTAAWHELCGHITLDPEYTPSLPGAGDGRGEAQPKFKDKTAMLEHSRELVEELFAPKTTAPRKKAIVETIAKYADVSIAANTVKTSAPKDDRKSAIAKVSRLGTLYNKAQKEADENPTEENKQKAKDALAKHEQIIKETGEKYPDWAEMRENKKND